MITKERIETELELIANKIKTGIANGKYSLSEVQEAVAQKSRRAARQTDYYVHDNAWKAIGITAALAFIGGMVLGKAAGSESADATGNKALDAEEAKPAVTPARLASWELLHSLLPLGVFLWKAAQSARNAKEDAESWTPGQ
jgi:ElaB/YqjD/DUF883 family membrane-anchored ribosome-binding protein